MSHATLPPLPVDDSIVHIYPSDLERMEKGEVTATAFSVAVGCPDERSVPLFTAEQMRDYAAAAHLAPLQQRVQPWMTACFGPAISADTQERNHRFIEEALELVQACGATQSEAHQLVDYVYGRPVGEKVQEVGGVMVTLAALCLAQGLDMHQAGEVELARIWTKVEQIRAKQAAKPKHSPLPAAAPVAAQEPIVLTQSDDHPELWMDEAGNYYRPSGDDLLRKRDARLDQPAQAERQPEPDEPCDNCGLGHPSSNCIYKAAKDEPTPPSRAAFISELESTAQNLLLGEDAVGAERVQWAAHLLRTAPPETWKVLPSQAAEEWVSIEERLPEPKTVVLLTVHYENHGEDDDGTQHITSGAAIDFGEYVNSEHGGYIEAFASPHGQHEYISHWKPLPTPAPMPASKPTGEPKQEAKNTTKGNEQ
jgi:hypothetical protein